GVGEDALMEAALEAGAEDVVGNDDGSFDVFTAFEEFGAGKDALDSTGFTSEAAGISRIPTTTTPLELDTAQKVIPQIDIMEDLDDVQNVYSNAEIPDDVLAQME